MTAPVVLYVILPLSEVTDEQIAICPETFETARYSIEPPERLILKFHSNPSNDLIFAGVPKFTVEDMPAILSGPDWSGGDS